MRNEVIRVGITGGIGSGKSTLCALLAARGAAVYDTDLEARRLMEHDAVVVAGVKRLFGEDVYRDGRLDRKKLAAEVFPHPERLQQLNALVHPAVKADFDRWCGEQKGDYVAIESAILFESGLDTQVDRTVAVLAPLELRLERACRRDGADPEAVRRRIAAQMSDDELARRADIVVVNIRREELEETAAELDKRFSNESRMV